MGESKILYSRFYQRLGERKILYSRFYQRMGEAKIVSEKQIWLHLVHLIKNGLSAATETKVNNIFYSSVYFQSFIFLIIPSFI